MIGTVMAYGMAVFFAAFLIRALITGQSGIGWVVVERKTKPIRFLISVVWLCVMVGLCVAIARIK